MARRPNNRWKGASRAADSKWELKLHEGLLHKWDFHNKDDIVEYHVEHKYHPDFVRTINGKTIYLETKGFFSDSAEASKYKWIRKALKENEELVFLFYKANKPMPHAKKRKDGTKLTHAGWAELNNFRWYDEESLPEELR